jgi:hypothetical protein
MEKPVWKRGSSSEASRSFSYFDSTGDIGVIPVEGSGGFGIGADVLHV